MKFRSFETPDWFTSVMRMRKTAIFVRRTRDVTLHDGCHGILATIKMVACDVTDRIDQSEEATYTKFSWETSHRMLRTGEQMKFSVAPAGGTNSLCCWTEQNYWLQRKGASCAHASLYYVKGSKFRNVSPEALSYRSGLFKFLVGKVNNLLNSEEFCHLGPELCGPLRGGIRFRGICRLHLQDWRISLCNKPTGLVTCFVPASWLVYSSILKMQATFHSETSVGFQRTTRNIIPKDRTFITTAVRTSDLTCARCICDLRCSPRWILKKHCLLGWNFMWVCSRVPTFQRNQRSSSSPTNFKMEAECSP
jgi:hypothetical protein